MFKLPLTLLFTVLTACAHGQYMYTSVKKYKYDDGTYFQINHAHKFGKFDSVRAVPGKNYIIRSGPSEIITTSTQSGQTLVTAEYGFDYVILKKGKIKINPPKFYLNGLAIQLDIKEIVLDVNEEDVKREEEPYNSPAALRKLNLLTLLGKDFYSKDVEKLVLKLSKPICASSDNGIKRCFYPHDALKLEVYRDSSIYSIVLFNGIEHSGTRYAYSGALPFGIKLTMNLNELTTLLGEGEIIDRIGFGKKVYRWMPAAGIYISAKLTFDKPNGKAGIIDEVAIYRKQK